MNVATGDASLPRFESRFTGALPADPELRNVRRQVFDACFSRVEPTPVTAPRCIAWWPEVAELVGLPRAFCESDDFAQVMAGNRLLPGMDPHALCYGGHQFGNWAGQLGDGRAINLGERVNAAGERYMLQLKGAGPTPYSRTADGRAVLRSSVREFLCSEAMHHLGVPTTRALSLVLTGEEVVRDMLYDGNPAPEPGAVVCRVAPSFLRFGNYELFAARGDLDRLRTLLDFTLTEHFPHLLPSSGKADVDAYVRWFEEVCERTAEMMVHWMRVGFVHGVMNTDNMSVLGLTIDYGPYGWLEDYDPDWTPNTTDAGGRRYRYGWQPRIALWNLAQLGNALVPLVEDVDRLQRALEAYAKTFEPRWRDTMAAKLGLEAFRGDADEALVVELEKLLTAVETDMTLFYRGLADVPVGIAANGEPAALEPLRPAFYTDAVPADHERALSAWLQRWAARVAADGTPDDRRRARMNRINPKYVLRNYLAQLAIDQAEAGDASMIHELMEVLRRPYEDQPGRERFTERRPEWARHRAGCSMLSCSS